MGRLVTGDQLDPKYAFIVRNKDTLDIPINLEQVYDTGDLENENEENGRRGRREGEEGRAWSGWIRISLRY
jgi:hypothetical protein